MSSDPVLIQASIRVSSPKLSEAGVAEWLFNYVLSQKGFAHELVRENDAMQGLVGGAATSIEGYKSRFIERHTTYWGVGFRFDGFSVEPKLPNVDADKTAFTIPKLERILEESGHSADVDPTHIHWSLDNPSRVLSCHLFKQLSSDEAHLQFVSVISPEEADSQYASLIAEGRKISEFLAKEYARLVMGKARRDGIVTDRWAYRKGIYEPPKPQPPSSKRFKF